MVTDSIADFLIRIQNGYRSRKRTVIAPHSRFTQDLANVLLKKGYIAGVATEEVPSTTQRKQSKRQLVVTLYYTDGKPGFEKVRRISKPGVRIYVDKTHIRRVRTGYGSAILSTSKGVLTDAEAKKAGVGGEVICEIY